jgi:hypothetical protein
MGTKRAKGDHLAPLAPSNVLKCVPGGGDPQEGLHFTKRLRSTGGTDLLKWGLPGGGTKSAKVAPTPYCMSRTPRRYILYANLIHNLNQSPQTPSGKRPIPNFATLLESAICNLDAHCDIMNVCAECERRSAPRLLCHGQIWSLGASAPRLPVASFYR